VRRIERTLLWRALRLPVAELRYRRERARLRREHGRTAKPAVLVFNHFFDNELQAMRESSVWQETFEILGVHHWNFFNHNWWYFPPDAWTYRIPCEDPRLARSRAKGRRHAKRILDDLQKHWNLVAVVAPIDQLWWIREFFFEARERGIKVVLFDKEGTISRASMETQPAQIRERYPPIADLYYVWSERQADFWTRCGAPRSHIRVLGSMRTDALARMPPAAARSVLYFDFDPWAYLTTLPAEVVARHPDDWSPLKRELHAVLLKAAREHPDVRFTFKLHPQQLDLAATRTALARSKPENVDVRWGARGVDQLLRDHGLVVGFQTTAVMEAALAGRTTIYVGWGPFHETVKEWLVPLFRPDFGAHVAPDGATLARWVDGFLDGTWTPKPPPKDGLEMFFHRPDGHVADRYAQALAEDVGLATARPATTAARTPKRQH